MKKTLALSLGLLLSAGALLAQNNGDLKTSQSIPTSKIPVEARG